LLRTSRPIRLGVLALAGIVAVGAVWWSTRPAPPPSVITSTTAPPRIPILVTAEHAGGPSVATGVPTTISAHALAAIAISALELWSQDGRVAVKRAERTRQAMYASWHWTPKESGETLLFARAIDSEGRVAQSNVIRLVVRAADGVAVTEAAPQVVLAALQSQPFLTAAAPRVAPGAVEPEPVLAFEPPKATATLNECMITVDVAGVPAAAGGLALYQLGPATATFVPILAFPTGDGAVSVEALVAPGTHLFSVSAFDGDSEVFSAPLTLEAAEGCATAGWSGSARLMDGELVVEPAVAVDSAYLYARVDDGVAIRIPSDPHTFILPAGDGTLTLGPHLPPMTGQKLDIEAWGWVEGQLVQLGAGTWVAPPKPTATVGGVPAELTTSPFHPSWPLPSNVTTLHHKTPSIYGASEEGVLGSGEFGYKLLTEGTIASYGNGTYGSTTFDFRWTTQLPGVTAVMWQVLPYPASPSSDLTPPFLVDAKTWLVPQGAAEGEFTIDFEPYLAGADGAAAIDAEEAKQSVGSALASVLTGPTGLPGPPQANSAPGDPVALAGALSLDLSMAPAGVEQEVGGLPVSFGNTSFHVRVIPLQGISAGIASNNVRFDVVPSQAVDLGGVPTSLAPPKVTFEFTPPLAADAAFSRCVVVKELTDAFELPAKGSFWYPIASTYQQAAGDPTQKFCYEPDEDDEGGLLGAFQAFVEFVADAVDFVATAYEDIKAAIVSVLAAPCGLIGIDQGTCDVVAEAALTVVLVAAGIPPSIPNFAAVVDGMKGDLANAVVSLAADLPGVATACDAVATGSKGSDQVPTCHELAAQAIDELIVHVEAQVSNAAAKSAGVLTYPGVVFVPHPEGIWHPPTFTVTVTNPSTQQAAAHCQLSAAVTSTITHTWDEVWPSHKLSDVTGVVSGDPFEVVTFTTPELSPGESVTREVVLAEVAEWWPNVGAENAYKLGSGGGWGSEAWALLQPGASLSARLSSCAGSETKGPYVLAEWSNQ
jgi:hypothetical protein